MTKMPFRFLLLTLFISIGINSYGKEQNDSSFVSTLLKEANELSYSNLDSSLQIANLALKLAQEIDFTEGEMSAFELLGDNTFEKGNNEQAEIYYYKAYELASENNNQLHKGIFYLKTGLIEHEVGNYDDAFENYLKAERIFKQGQFKKELAICYLNISVNYYRLKDPNKSIDYIQRYFDIYQHINEFDAKVNFFILAGKAYFNAGIREKGRINYAKAYELLKDQTDNPKWAESFAEIAYHQAALNNKSIAKSLVNQSIFLTKKSGRNRKWAKAINFKAHVFRILGDYNSAIVYYKKALIQCDKYNIAKEKLAALKELAFVYEKTGNYQDAFYTMKQMSTYNDSLYGGMNTVKIGQLEQQLISESKLREKDSAINQKTKSFISIIVFISVALLVILIVLIWLIKRSKKEQSTQDDLINNRERLKNLVRQKNREVVARNLHLLQYDELHDQVTKKLLQVKLRAKTNENKALVQDIVNEIKLSGNANAWDEFEKSFVNVNQDFYKNLYNEHPNLSTSERKLCALLRLNLTTKEIATLTFQTITSVDTARGRLRKKMNLGDRTLSLSGYLSGF